MHLAWRWRCIFTFENWVPHQLHTSRVKLYVLVKSAENGSSVVYVSGSKGLVFHFSYLSVVVINRLLATDCFIPFMRCFWSLCLDSLWRTYFHFKLWKAREQMLSVVKAVVYCMWMYFEKLWSLLALSRWGLFVLYPTPPLSIILFIDFFLYFRLAWQLVWCIFNSFSPSQQRPSDSFCLGFSLETLLPYRILTTIRNLL